jgi:Terminase RNaseH-like domain
MVKRDTIQRYDHLPIREQSHRVIQSWDTAIKVDATNDCSVCATLLVDEHRNYYLLEVLRDRLLYPELKAQAISQAEKHKPDTILIEEGGLGRTLVKDLKAAGLPAVGVVPDPVRALPRDERELFTAASHSHVLAFDNVSGLPPWLSDSLCRLTSGGAFSTRRLFTDQDEILFTAARPIILNGIEDIIIRPDLADRAIVLMLAPIAERQRRPEHELWREFELARPYILGVLLDAAARGLHMLPHARLRRLPRMARPRAALKPPIPTTGATRSRTSSMPTRWRCPTRKARCENFPLFPIWEHCYKAMHAADCTKRSPSICLHTSRNGRPARALV